MVQEKHHHHHHLLSTTEITLQLVRWRCGYAGVRVGEAAHPGPVAVSPAKPQTPSAARRLRAAPGWEDSVVTAGMSPARQRTHWSVSQATWSDSDGSWGLKRQSALRSWRLWATGSGDGAVKLQYGRQSHRVQTIHSAVRQWRDIAATAPHRKQKRQQQQRQHSSQRLQQQVGELCEIAQHRKKERQQQQRQQQHSSQRLQQQVGELQWKVQLQQQFIEEQSTVMAELRQQDRPRLARAIPYKIHESYFLLDS